MAIDFTFSPEVDQARQRIRDFLHGRVKVEFAELRKNKEATRDDWSALIKGLRKEARESGNWLPHMPAEVGGMGLGVTALAAVSAEAAKVPYGPYIINGHAPDEGNMHTLHHFAMIRGLCSGHKITTPSSFGMAPSTLKHRELIQEHDG